MLESHLGFSGKMIQVHVDTVELPNGRRATREVVEHRPAVVIIPFDEKGDVVLVRQYRYAVRRALLEAPAGGVEPDEDPDECAQRELQEEVGLYAEDLQRVGGFWTAPGVFTEFMHVYVARELRRSKLPTDFDEALKTERVSVTALERLIRDGEILDGKTIAATYMTLRLPL